MSLGDRIKKYEAVTRGYATRRTPLMIRVDGRAFHTFTRGFNKPFDDKFTKAMVFAAAATAMEMQGFKAAYVQSDEVTFCITDYDANETQGWFDYNLSKIISISASLMTGHFIEEFEPDYPVTFDSRAFSIPADDVVNAFLWRAKDWERNSLQMYAQSFFSHKQLHKKSKDDIHEMLHGIGKNWAKDLTPRQKNGTFIITDPKLKFVIKDTVLPRFTSINRRIGRFFKYP